MVATLRVREVPFDVAEALRAETVGALVDDFGAAGVLATLALGVMTEFLELLLNHLHRKHHVLADRPDARAFIQQELRHSSALHAVNKALAGESYTTGPIGRVSATAAAVFADDLARIGRVLAGEEAAEPFLRDATAYAAVNEIIVGLPAALVEFAELEADRAGLRLRHPAFFYVVLYHAAEEAEHTHVMWEHYGDHYGVQLLGDGIGRTRAAFDRFERDHGAVMAILAQRLGLPLSSADIDAVPMRVLLRRHVERLLTAGVEPTLYADLRRSCVEAWDGRWEPVFRAAVESALG